MEDEYESAQQAFLVGRYLKDNGLSETLECFLRETPIKMVPKMRDDMQSLPQILGEFWQLLKDREELKEKKRRIQQYEEILNLLFEELRDVYNFQSLPVANSAFTSADMHSTVGASHMSTNKSDMSSTTPERQFILSDFNGDDDQLIEDFCLQNLNHHSAGSCGRIVPVVLPKKAMDCNMTTSEGLHGVVHEESKGNGTISARPEGHGRAQMLEHHYNRIREHRRINRHSKHRFLGKPISPTSSFVAYSSLPLSSSKACGHNSRELMVSTNTQKQSRSKKHVDANGSWIDEPHERNSMLSCANMQSASCKESSPFKICCKKQAMGNKFSLKGSGLNCNGNSGFGEEGLPRVCCSNPSSEAKLNQAGLQNEDDVIVDDAIGFDTKRSFMKFDQKLGKKSNPSSYQCDIDWTVLTSLHHTCDNTTDPSSMCACTIHSTADSGMITESNQLIERNDHVPCSGAFHYKVFLREKFFSTRRRQRTAIHQQKPIHHCEEQYCGSTASLDHVHDDDSQNCGRICSNNCTNIDREGEHVDVALLATETANLLERLLPLVADPDTMQSFINNLDTHSPRTSPRDHTLNHWYLHHPHTELEKTGISRPQGIREQIWNQGETDKSDEMLEEANNMNDDASVLAELEEAVGKTVDDILRRYVLISPPPPLPISPSPPPPQ